MHVLGLVLTMQSTAARQGTQGITDALFPIGSPGVPMRQRRACRSVVDRLIKGRKRKALSVRTSSSLWQASSAYKAASEQQLIYDAGYKHAFNQSDCPLHVHDHVPGRNC